MKISYVTFYNPHDIHEWSGSGYYIAKAIKDQNNEMEYIYDFDIKMGITNYYRRLINKIMGKEYQMRRSPFVIEQYARQIEQKISTDSDVIFSPGSVDIALVKSKVPKAFMTDATFAGMLGFYPTYSKLSPTTIEFGHQLEQAAIDSSNLCIYSSQWAARSAIDYYHADPAKVKVVPFGANIESDRTLDTIKSLVQQKPENECHLLFIGIHWIRKGGKIALQIAQALNNMGLKTTLHLVGIDSIPEKKLPDFVINHGFISKSTPEGSQKLNDLFSKCHFLLVPTQAEAYGLVFCEANSFGLPAIATQTGGVTTIIKDDLNGRTFPLDSEPEDYAKFIASYFNDFDKYKELALSSFNEYEKRLNWKVAGREITRLLKSL